MDELKPCPFCGGEAAATGKMRYDESHEAQWADGSQVLEAFFCNCVKCGSTNAGLLGHQTREKAIAAWNRRAPVGAEPVAALSLKRLCDALVDCEVVFFEAVHDPEGYDGGVTLGRIEALHRALFAHPAAPAPRLEEAPLTDEPLTKLVRLSEEMGLYDEPAAGAKDGS